MFGCSVLRLSLLNFEKYLIKALLILAILYLILLNPLLTPKEIGLIVLIMIVVLVMKFRYSIIVTPCLGLILWFLSREVALPLICTSLLMISRSINPRVAIALYILLTTTISYYTANYLELALTNILCIILINILALMYIFTLSTNNARLLQLLTKLLLQASLISSIVLIAAWFLIDVSTIVIFGAMAIVVLLSLELIF